MFTLDISSSTGGEHSGLEGILNGGATQASDIGRSAATCCYDGKRGSLLNTSLG
jgi:hypothetical protein